MILRFTNLLKKYANDASCQVFKIKKAIHKDYKISYRLFKYSTLNQNWSLLKCSTDSNVDGWNCLGMLLW